MDNIFHINKVHLSGYRTIKDVNIEFVPGLNIIIGNNGVGKSNFLRFLNSVINIELDEYAVIDCRFDWDGDGMFEPEEWEVKQNFKKEDDKRFVSNVEINISNKAGGTLHFDSTESMFKQLNSTPHKWFFSDYLPHVIHSEERLFLTKPFETKATGYLFLQFRNRRDLPYFLSALLVNMSFNLFDPQSPINRNKAETVEESIRQLIDFNFFSGILKEISVIQDFRFKSDFEVRVIEGNVGIQNLLFEFLVNGEWIPYNGLSDGTKRIFNIIVDIATQEKYMNAKDIWGEGIYLDRIILIEEPELGIHPHQLYKLMRFIKEQSKTKQIIITTHSPEVLDILGKDDLDRIILADYDSEKGTQLRHLDESEKKEATTFLQNVAFLSDYWKHSTLEAR